MNIDRFRTMALLFPYLLLCVGCNELDELFDETSTMYAEFEVVAESEYGFSTVRAKVRSKRITGDLITLDSPDAFWASSNGERKQLTLPATILTPSPEYSAVFGNNAAGNTVFSISLNREGKADAPNSTATLPDSFIVDFPSDGSTIPRSNNITYIWTPGQSNWIMEIRTIIYCVRGVGEQTISEETIFEFDDSDGMAILTPEEHSPSAVLGFNGECSFRVIFSRINTGTIDTTFFGGYFNAIQRRDIYITTTSN